MSVKGEISTDIYQQMMDLQEKLRQSEAERLQLKEMFTVLVKTFREEENIRLKSLEHRYHTFLEDCARRSNRNEKILRSVERVESGANALHAKTERLKLLRSHYESYLERTISTWRQSVLQRHGPIPLQSTQEVEWRRRNQLIHDDKVEPMNSNYLPLSRFRRPDGSDPFVTSEYFPNRPTNGERYIKLFRSERNRFDENYWNRMSREIEGKGKLIDSYDKTYQGEFKHFEPIIKGQSRALRRRLESEVVDDMSAVRELESALHRKLVLETKPGQPVEHLYQKGVSKEIPEAESWDDVDHALHKRAKSTASPAHTEERWASDRRSEAFQHGVGNFDKGYMNSTPRMTREPVEIKKPEIIVGKIHPESPLRGEYFNKSPNFETASNINPDSLFRPINDANSSKNGKFESESAIPETEVRTLSPLAKWSLLKHRRTVDKLKETLSYGGEQEQNVAQGIKQSENLSVKQKPVEELRKEDDETDVSQSLSENWRHTGEEAMSSRLAVHTDDKESRQRNGSELLPPDGQIDFESTNQEHFKEFPQKDVNDMNEEAYEDNEESYPESYYEQPAKSDYSRDIVSNVILEEDESEANLNDELPEGSVHNQEAAQVNNVYNQSQYHVDQDDNIQNNYNGYSADGTGEIKVSENEYQHFQPNDPGYNADDMYQANYSDMQPQDGFIYDNQDVNHYNANTGGEYTTMEQYPESNGPQPYYEGQQPEEHGNYASEGMGQGENFENTYNQVQNYENNPVAVEQYNEVGGIYQQEYNQSQGENYYQGEGYEGYYQSQQEQPGEYPVSNEIENVAYTETTACENSQDGDVYADESNNLPLRQSNLSHLLESDSESFQMEHGSAAANEDSDFDFSMSQQQ